MQDTKAPLHPGADTQDSPQQGGRKGNTSPSAGFVV